MNFVKKVWNKIKYPKTIPLILFYIIFAGLVAATLTMVIINPEHFVNYILYVLSAIALAYFVWTIIYIAPKIKNKIILFLRAHKWTNEMLENYGYRTIIFSVFSFILNIAYVAFLGVLAIMSKSVWYGAIAIYYFVLSMLKGIIFNSKKKHKNDEKHEKLSYKTCGILFVFLTLALSGIIVLIYTSNMYFEYAGLMIYAVAAYTFYKLTLAIFNIIKAKKQDDLYVQGIRNINLASALVSIIVLQVALFQAFAPEHNTSFANGLTGGAVSLIILTLGILMIVRSNKELKQEIKNEEWFWI